MSLPDRFETASLAVRRTTFEETAAILAGDIPPALTFGPGYPTEQALEVADLIAGERQAEAVGFTSWFMLLRHSGEVIGEIGYTPSADGLTATAGYDISPEFERQGYTSEALAGLIRHLFTHTRVAAIRADTLTGHTASRKVMENAGMRFLRDYEADVDGLSQRLVLYEIVKDWWTSPAAP